MRVRVDDRRARKGFQLEPPDSESVVDAVVRSITSVWKQARNSAYLLRIMIVSVDERSNGSKDNLRSSEPAGIRALVNRAWTADQDR